MGSQEYPYKNLKSAFSEILNYFSNKDININIFIKEGTRAYLEDNYTFLINITSVTLKSYSDTNTTPMRATLSPTKVSQPSFDGNASFSLIKNTDMRLSEKIAEGNLSERELLFIGAFSSTFSVVKTGIYFYNIDIYREAVDVWQGNFLHLVSLQEKWLDIQYSTFNISGEIIAVNDPLNVRLENILLDTHTLNNGFAFGTPCNYPEAELDVNFLIDNLTSVLSTERKFIKNPTIVYYAGPGNITILNMNHEDTYATSKNPQASLIIAIRDYCQPSDENWRTIDVHNGNYSLPDNPYGVKMNIVVILTNLNLYKEIKINITNHRFINYVESVSQLLYLVGNHAVEVYTSNIYFENVESNIVYAEFKFFRLAMIDQFTFKSISSSENKVAILVQFILAVIITDTVLEDINGTERTSLPLIFLNNFAPSYILISGLKIKNSYMMNRKILNNIASLQTLTITGGEYDEVTQSTGGVLFSTGIIGQLIFTNHTFTNMLSSDRTSKILELTNIDLSYGLNSTIQDISLSNSTSGVFGFNGISNSNTSPLVILINNLKYSDSILKSVKSLIVTKNLV